MPTENPETTTGRELNAREFFSGLDPNAKPYIPEVDGDDEPLSPEYEAEIREWVDGMAERKDIRYYGAHQKMTALLAEVDRLRAELAEVKRPAVEAERAKIRSSFTALISQAEQDRDYVGASDLAIQLDDREKQWAAEDAKAVVR